MTEPSDRSDRVERADQNDPADESASRGSASRKLPRWAAAIAVVSVLVLLAWVIGFSGVLGVRSVQVRGTRSVSAAQVREVAGIRPGAPLLRLDTSAILRRVAALPIVRSAQVSTSYPSTVTISIQERVAVGYRFAPGGVSVLDRDDVAFRSSKTPPKGLPRIDVSGGAPLNSDRMDAAATVAGSLPAALARKVALITAPTPESVTLRLSDGRTVLWGGTDHSADKAKLLPALITQPGTYFDLSDPTSVISRGAPSTGN